MKSYVRYMFVFLMLFTSMEGAIDLAPAEHMHTDGHTHVEAGLDHVSTDADDEEHCSHSCHSHTASLLANLLTHYDDTADEQIDFYQSHFLNFSQAPPTPPPTA